MSTSGGSPRRTRTSAPARPVRSPALVAALDQIETKIRTRKTEVGYILSPQGEIIARQSGTKRQVKWSKEDAAKSRGNIFTHNHPPDVSLSPQDFAFAMTNQVAEIRAVSAGHTYVARPGANGWNRDLWLKMKPVAEGMTLTRKLLFREMMRRDLITSEEGNQRIFHEIWTELSKRFGFIYERTPA